ncbi:MAG: glycoside hydrolase family 88 protein [Clostridia bacterium]|nr:glycoside hydrolase family 88 protein [Clostridia bacterium]MBQ7751732.1 glycoside hydrolase family 88 protein [Clostridia bacterium]
MNIHEIKKMASEKIAKTASCLKDALPYTTQDGKYDDLSERRAHWWTNSFWAGILWQMYDVTSDKTYADYAVGCEKKLEKVLYEYKRDDHDLGFLWLLTGVEHFRHFKDEKAKNDTLLAASILASRYDLTAKVIRAWNGEKFKGLAIIDCMMNLPLLYWASEQEDDARFKKIAMSHADSVIQNFVREDGSVCHIVRFDTETGEKLEDLGGQGYKQGSSWTRGQGWAIYGFIQSYQWTKEQRYLDTAKKVADYFIGEAKKNNYIIKCDFCQPEGDNLYDSSAAAVASCGMIEIYKETGDERYLKEAKKLILATSENFCPWDDKEDMALVNFGSESFEKHEHLALIYGDYYFFRAVCEFDEILK